MLAALRPVNAYVINWQLILSQAEDGKTHIRQKLPGLIKKYCPNIKIDNQTKTLN